MEEFGKALKTIFDKIGDFFDIFDLSFFVAGIGTGSAFLYLYYLNNEEFKLPVSSSFLRVLLVVVFFYLIGLISFALGRYLRLELWWKSSYKKMDDRLRIAIKVHGLDEREMFKKYLNNHDENRGAWRLYVRLWAKLRDDPKLLNSFAQVKRYWVMSGTYDGVVISLITWALSVCYLVFIDRSLISIDKLWGSISIFLLLLSALGCSKEAQRNLLNQAEEIIAIEANSIASKLY